MTRKPMAYSPALRAAVQAAAAPDKPVPFTPMPWERHTAVEGVYTREDA